MTEEAEVTQEEQPEETEEERLAKVIKSYVDGWNNDWGLLVSAVSEETGLSKAETITYLQIQKISDITKAVKELHQALYHPELLEQAGKIQQEVIDQMEDGEDWKDGEDGG